MGMLQYPGMDRKSFIMILIIAIATLVSIYFLYQRSYNDKSFEIIDDNTLNLSQNNS